MSVGPKTTLMLSRVTISDGTMGDEIYTWADVKNISGVFSILSDREKLMYGKYGEMANYKFIVDYVFASAIDTADRFILGSRIFEIVGRENSMNQNRFIVLLLTENVNG